MSPNADHVTAAAQIVGATVTTAAAATYYTAAIRRRLRMRELPFGGAIWGCGHLLAVLAFSACWYGAARLWDPGLRSIWPITAGINLAIAVACLWLLAVLRSARDSDVHGPRKLFLWGALGMVGAFAVIAAALH